MDPNFPPRIKINLAHVPSQLQETGLIGPNMNEFSINLRGVV